MWLPDALIRPLLMLAVSLALTGCFRPMYASLDDGSSPVIEELSRINVAPIEGRVGQQVRNELLYAFSPGAATDAPYKLVVTLKGSTEDTVLQRTGEAVTKIYELRANFTLIEPASGKVLYGGSSMSRASYDRTTQLFANQRSALDAEDRAAKVIAENVKTRIAVYFASRG